MDLSLVLPAPPSNAYGSIDTDSLSSAETDVSEAPKVGPDILDSVDKLRS